MNAAKRATTAAVLELLVERFPRCFAIYQLRRRPLKIGIRADLEVALDGAVTPAELALALRIYATATGYLQNSRAGVARIDLAGNVVGIVTEDEAAHARLILITRRKKAAPQTSRALGKSKDGGAGSDFACACKIQTRRPPPRIESPRARLATSGIPAAATTPPKANKPATPESATPEPASPKRLGLADLKLAGARRRTATGEAP